MRGGLPGADGVFGDGAGFVHVDAAGAVIEKCGVAVVDDDMSGFFCGTDDTGGVGVLGVVVGVVAVGLAVGSGVEKFESSLGGEEEVPVVAGGVEADESCCWGGSDDVKGCGVEVGDAFVVGDGDACGACWLFLWGLGCCGG